MYNTSATIKWEMQLSEEVPRKTKSDKNQNRNRSIGGIPLT